MKVKTTEKQFGQTIQYDCEIERLTYKQLQAYIKEAKAQGFTGIKLNASKEALQAEVEAIEASKAKATKEVEVEASVETVSEPLVNFTNADAVYYTVVNPEGHNVSSCDVYGRSEGNVEHRCNYPTLRGVYAAACTLPPTKEAKEEGDGIAANFVHFDRINRVAVGDRKLEASVSLRDQEFMSGDESGFHYAFVPCCLLVSYTKATILQDPLDELIACCEAEPYKPTVVIDDEGNTWVDGAIYPCHGDLGMIHKTTYEGYEFCFIPTGDLVYTYDCLEAHRGVFCRLTCDVLNGQKCDVNYTLDLGTMDVQLVSGASKNRSDITDLENADLLASNTVYIGDCSSRLNGIYLMTCEDIPATLAYGLHDNKQQHFWCTGHGAACSLPNLSKIVWSDFTEYGATISKWVEGVEGIHKGDHYPGQAVYPDWGADAKNKAEPSSSVSFVLSDKSLKQGSALFLRQYSKDESYTYGSYLNSYCELACDLPVEQKLHFDLLTSGVVRQDIKQLIAQDSDLPQPYIHPELGLVNGGSLTTTLLPRVTKLKIVVEGKTDLVQHVTFSAAVKGVNRIFDRAASKGHDLVLYIGLDQYFDRTYYDWHKVEGMTIFSTTEPTIEYKPVGDDAFLATDLLDDAYVVSPDLLRHLRSKS